jgi:acyl CoA:acetate/3-ketoacid CoA transferase beta subunit
LGEFEFRDNGLNLTALAPDVTVDEIEAKTDAEYKVAL